MLTRWDPFRDMLAMLGDESTTSRQGDYLLPLDVAENDNDYFVKASLPGVKPDNIDVTYRNGILTISGQTQKEQDVNNEQYHMRERSFGTFRRSISLPGDINPDKIQANFEDGVLNLTLPKSEKAKPKRIPVKGQSHSQQIEGQFNKNQTK